jgi:hypothetical protein
MYIGFKSFLVLAIITCLIAISVVGIRLAFRRLSAQMAASDYGRFQTELFLCFRQPVQKNARLPEIGLLPSYSKFLRTFALETLG